MTNTAKTLSVALLIIAALLTGYFLSDLNLVNDLGNSNSQISEQKAKERVSEYLDTQNSNAEIDSINSKTGSLYEVILNTKNGLTKIYITKDGQHIVNQPVNITQTIDFTRARNDFIKCLEEKQVQIYGNINSNATIAQLQVLGGYRGLDNVYMQLNNQTMKSLVQRGVKRIPVTIYNGSAYQGIQTAEFFQNEVGCNITAG